MEVRQVAERNASRRVLTGAQATKAALLTELRERDLFYFAGHSRVVPADPGRSHLVLAAGSTFGDGILLASEIGAMDLRGLQQVVLSSCGRTQDDDLALGSGNPLAAAYLDAGVSVVIATNRELPDAAPLSEAANHGWQFRFVAR
jgi:CHAT domain-containing protein